jgi:hypothetical protein
VTVFGVLDDPREVEDAEGEKRTVPRWIAPRCAFVAGEAFETTAPL